MSKKKPEKIIVKSNALIEAKQRLNLWEVRLIHMCISQVKKGEIMGRHVIRVEEMKGLVGATGGETYRYVKESAINLMSRRVTITATPEGKPLGNKVLVTSWVQAVEYMDDEGQLTMHLNPHIIPYLSRLTREFTQYSVEILSKLTSVHTIRLYELLAQWRSTGKRKLSFSWLRSRLFLENSYKSSADFKYRVIGPALEQISKHTDIKITDCIYEKTGRKLTSVNIKFKTKTPARSRGAPPNGELFPVKDKWATHRAEVEAERKARVGEPNDIK